MGRRGRTLLRLGALLCAGVAAIAAVSEIRPDNAASASTTAGEPAATTPLWSPRRVPALFTDAAVSAARTRANAALDERLQQIIGGHDVCVAADVGGTPIARINDTASAPASTLKIMTGVAAIATMGNGYRFTTRAVAGGGGSLTIVGAGDPVLATPAYIATRGQQTLYRDGVYTPLAQLADSIVAAGVRSLPGGLIVDDHTQDSLRFLPQWKAEYAADGDIGALGALAVDGGTAAASYATAAADPAIVTAQKLAALLSARGVKVGPLIRHGVASADAREVAHVDSPTLGAIVANMLTVSNDFTAEELVRDMAAHAQPNEPATTAHGLQVMESTLRSLGVPVAGVTIYDGSGLAHADRVPCTVLLRAVEVASQPRFAAVAAGLPVGGRTGTLVDRFLDPPFTGRVHAKTGTLDGVSGLAGRVDLGADPSFAVLAAGPFGSSSGRSIVDDVARVVGEYPVVRAPADLVPAP